MMKSISSRGRLQLPRLSSNRRADPCPRRLVPTPRHPYQFDHSHPQSGLHSLFPDSRPPKPAPRDFEVSARGGAGGREARPDPVSDSLKRSIDILPDGQRHDSLANGTLQPNTPTDIPFTLPPSLFDGSLHATVKIYPSTFSQVVEGLDNIFQMPSGCFEQTSSTTYPNVLALNYLQQTKKSSPKTEATARQFINLGYQRLLSFEIKGGGFDWFGRPPADRTLTAYGFMEFQDMARVSSVDPNLLAPHQQVAA